MSLDEKGNIIHPSVRCGDNFEIGYFNLIEEDVIFGDNVKIKNFAELRVGTKFGNGCYIDSRVSTSGGETCIIGDDCKLRYGVIIARNVEIGDRVFLSPHVKFVNIPFVEREERTPTVLGDDVRIGMGSVINDGIFIVDGTIIGALSFVRKSIHEKGVYGGNPLKKLG